MRTVSLENDADSDLAEDGAVYRASVNRHPDGDEYSEDAYADYDEGEASEWSDDDEYEYVEDEDDVNPFRQPGPDDDIQSSNNYGGGNPFLRETDESEIAQAVEPVETGDGFVDGFDEDFDRIEESIAREEFAQEETLSAPSFPASSPPVQQIARPSLPPVPQQHEMPAPPRRERVQPHNRTAVSKQVDSPTWGSINRRTSSPSDYRDRRPSRRSQQGKANNDMIIDSDMLPSREEMRDRQAKPSAGFGTSSSDTADPKSTWSRRVAATHDDESGVTPTASLRNVPSSTVSSGHLHVSANRGMRVANAGHRQASRLNNQTPVIQRVAVISDLPELAGGQPELSSRSEESAASSQESLNYLYSDPTDRQQVIPVIQLAAAEKPVAVTSTERQTASPLLVAGGLACTICGVYGMRIGPKTSGAAA